MTDYALLLGPDTRRYTQSKNHSFSVDERCLVQDRSVPFFARHTAVALLCHKNVVLHREERSATTQSLAIQLLNGGETQEPPRQQYTQQKQEHTKPHTQEDSAAPLVFWTENTLEPTWLRPNHTVCTVTCFFLKKKKLVLVTNVHQCQRQLRPSLQLCHCVDALFSLGDQMHVGGYTS